ncbi:GNAT family N-acetyltransferase [Lancefieldella rimae]|uniref:GNAT family N-acetyltransferase n=1 Tax=Lancefieldella rimae TaxID=1383 RepID=UPI002889F12A|nr:GNAT family N-acetyltransferase [Lancefieldella rimae]
MEIKEYQTYNEQEIIDLYQSVGWTNYTSCPEMLEEAYKNSLCILGAFEKEKLVGVVRVVGDGISIVFVQDILVLPEYQRQGVGSALMRAILKKYASVYQVELLTDSTEKSKAFYSSVGLAPVSELGCSAYIRMSAQ